MEKSSDYKLNLEDIESVIKNVKLNFRNMNARKASLRNIVVDVIYSMFPVLNESLDNENIEEFLKNYFLLFGDPYAERLSIESSNINNEIFALIKLTEDYYEFELTIFKSVDKHIDINHFIVSDEEDKMLNGDTLYFKNQDEEFYYNLPNNIAYKYDGNDTIYCNDVNENYVASILKDALSAIKGEYDINKEIKYARFLYEMFNNNLLSLDEDNNLHHLIVDYDKTLFPFLNSNMNKHDLMIYLHNNYKKFLVNGNESPYGFNSFEIKDCNEFENTSINFFVSESDFFTEFEYNALGTVLKINRYVANNGKEDEIGNIIEIEYSSKETGQKFYYEYNIDKKCLLYTIDYERKFEAPSSADILKINYCINLAIRFTNYYYRNNITMVDGNEIFNEIIEEHKK